MKLPFGIAAVLLVAYSLFLQFGPQPKKVRIQSQWQENRYVLEKYFRSSASAESEQPKIVIAGSSLSERLDFSRFGACVYNAALSGESQMTGIAAVIRADQHPAQVFVEINIATRKANQDLIEKADSILSKNVNFLRTENMPINKIFSFISSGTKGPKASSINSKVFENALETKMENYGTPIPETVLKSRLDELLALTQTLQKKGTEVIFYEMPINSRLKDTPQTLQIRNAFQRKFSNYRMITQETLAGVTPPQTVDGIHLDPDEAQKTSEILSQTFQPACSARMGPGFK
jgi:hypothetical protein